MKYFKVCYAVAWIEEFKNFTSLPPGFTPMKEKREHK